MLSRPKGCIVLDWKNWHHHMIIGTLNPGFRRRHFNSCSLSIDFFARFKYEAALVKGYYGQLLCKWDKREALGNTYRGEAKHFIENYHHKLGLNGRFPITPQIHLPQL